MKRESIVAAARAWCGTPYRHQAALRGAGCDCLGLVRGVWRDLIGSEPMALPPYAADWRHGGGGDALLVAAAALMQPAQRPAEGQVLVFRIGPDRSARHCGIATAGQGFIHAQEGLGVVDVPLSDGWLARLAGRFDFPGVED